MLDHAFSINQRLSPLLAGCSSRHSHPHLGSQCWWQSHSQHQCGCCGHLCVPDQDQLGCLYRRHLAQPACLHQPSCLCHCPAASLAGQTFRSGCVQLHSCKQVVSLRIYARRHRSSAASQSAEDLWFTRNTKLVITCKAGVVHAYCCLLMLELLSSSTEKLHVPLFLIGLSRSRYACSRVEQPRQHSACCSSIACTNSRPPSLGCQPSLSRVC